MAGNSQRIPHFIAAPTPKGLVRAMLLNNLRDGMEYQYFSIQKDGKQWVAWYVKEMKVRLSADPSTPIEVPDGD